MMKKNKFHTEIFSLLFFVNLKGLNHGPDFIFQTSFSGSLILSTKMSKNEGKSKTIKRKTSGKFLIFGKINIGKMQSGPHGLSPIKSLKNSFYTKKNMMKSVSVKMKVFLRVILYSTTFYSFCRVKILKSKNISLNFCVEKKLFCPF